MSHLKLTRMTVACGLAIAGLAGGLIASQRAASNMVTAANKFLEGLTPEQRQQAALPLDSDDLTRWHYVPTNQFPRKGLPIKDMTEPQRKLAHDLLRTGLSQRGYTDGDRHHATSRRCCGRSRAQPKPGGGLQPRPGALLLHDLRHALGEGRRGAGG